MLVYLTDSCNVFAVEVFKMTFSAKLRDLFRYPSLSHCTKHGRQKPSRMGGDLNREVSHT